MEYAAPNNLHTYGNYINVDDLLRKLYLDAFNNWFYQDANTLVVNLDIIFTNIMLLTRGASPGVVNSPDLLKKFLMLLVHILEMWQAFPQNKGKFDKTRLCELLRIIVDGPKAEDFLTAVNRIVRAILENFPVADDSSLSLNLFSECLQKSVENELFQDVCSLLLTAIKLGLFNEAIFAKDWILKNLPKFINLAILMPSYSITTALQCLDVLYKSENFRENISRELFSHTNAILTLCCHNNYKHRARAILTEMISDFTAINNTPWKKQYPPLVFFLLDLPDELEIWHKSGNDVFFLIALILRKCTTEYQWQTLQITIAIAERVKKCEIIVAPVLKAMCYFFPKSLHYKKEQWFTQTSCRLIDRLECSGVLCDVITPSRKQLAWILNSSASEATKFLLLETWLKEDLLDSLVSALECYGLEDILLDYMQKVPANPLTKKAAIVASKIKSATLPKKVTVTLMQNLTYMDLFSNLLLSKPALPTEKNQSLALCAVLGANLPYVQDKDVLITLCNLSSLLLASLKDEPKAMLKFCQGDGRNVKVIFGAAISSDDDVGFNALNLLVVLLQVQIRNDVKLEKPVETNLARLMRGSDSRKKHALKLMKLVLNYRHRKPLYLNYSDDISLGIYQRLHDFCGTEMSDISYTCMLKMLQGDPVSFKFSVVTYALMEMQWNYPQGCAKSAAFLKFAQCWLQHVEESGFYELPKGMKECFFEKENEN